MHWSWAKITTTANGLLNIKSKFYPLFWQILMYFKDSVFKKKDCTSYHLSLLLVSLVRTSIWRCTFSHDVNIFLELHKTGQIQIKVVSTCFVFKSSFKYLVTWRHNSQINNSGEGNGSLLINLYICSINPCLLIVHKKIQSSCEKAQENNIWLVIFPYTWAFLYNNCPILSYYRTCLSYTFNQVQWLLTYQ